MNIQKGCCHCGCGEKTPIATRNYFADRKIPIYKGEPVRFLRGHNHPQPINYFHLKGNQWNTGRKHTEELKQRLSQMRVGAKHWNWQGGISSENSRERNKFRRELQNLIFNRDGYRCQICDSNKDLQVDHIASWAEFKELRFNPENCRTLCAKCHYKITFNKEMPSNVKTWGRNFGRRVFQ